MAKPANFIYQTLPLPLGREAAERPECERRVALLPAAADRRGRGRLLRQGPERAAEFSLSAFKSWRLRTCE